MANTTVYLLALIAAHQMTLFLCDQFDRRALRRLVTGTLAIVAALVFLP